MSENRCDLETLSGTKTVLPYALPLPCVQEQNSHIATRGARLQDTVFLLDGACCVKVPNRHPDYTTEHTEAYVLILGW